MERLLSVDFFSTKGREDATFNRTEWVCGLWPLSILPRLNRFRELAFLEIFLQSKHSGSFSLIVGNDDDGLMSF
jgi:hypothetical protein